MLEVNANASFAGRHKLSTNGEGLLVIDGPEGFRLNLAHVGGAPCQLAGVDVVGKATGRRRVLKPGDSVPVTRRLGVWTSGPSSYVHISRAS